MPVPLIDTRGQARTTNAKCKDYANHSAKANIKIKNNAIIVH